MLIGSETQSQEHQVVLTGIQRVICESHKVLFDSLGALGINIGWVNTREIPRSMNFMEVPYLTQDPVLTGMQARLSEISLLLLLDMPGHMDFLAVTAERKRRTLPVVALLYDVLPLTHTEWFPERANLNFKLYLQQILFIADHIVVTSDQVRHDLETLGWKRSAPIKVIPLGSIFPQRARSSAPDDQLSILCISTLAPRKGHAELLDSFDELRLLGVDIDLTLVGNQGWECDDLVERIRNHPDMKGRLKWIQHADDHTIQVLATRCNMGVIPAEGEGFGLFLEEGLTLGLKMVASNIPVFRERPHPNITYFDRQTGNQLTHAILEAANKKWVPIDPGEVRPMSKFGLELSDLILEVLEENRVKSTEGE